MLWRVLYIITLVGQLKTNVPIFLGICFLLLLTGIRIFVDYRKHMKKDYVFQSGSQIEINETELVILSSYSLERHVFPLECLSKIQKNKKWYFLYFKDKTFIPISKKTVHSPEQINDYFTVFKPTLQVLWNWTVIILLVVTIVGGYNVWFNAVNFNGALALKINEWKTETRIKLEDDNFYATKLDGIIDSVKAKMELEPILMTEDVEIRFEQDGTITDIDMYIYGFDQNRKLQSTYSIFIRDNKVKVQKHDWKGERPTVYNPNSDLSIVIKMLEWIPVKNEVKRWNEEKYAVLYKGIKNWGAIHEGIHYIDENGEAIPETVDPGNYGPTISLYVPGKEEMITPQRYIYKPFFREDDLGI
jgi:hypothetical protein